ncbi:MAG: hypothetical protein BGO49_27080 [Planctomycetales bacterium 71-10]|nr:MAG: hypothetical protein BGO49_27080 [Planctomycetales bacterium 71-10]
MDSATREFVRRRADGRCEYGFIRQGHAETLHHVDHIRARRHGGGDGPSNLALAGVGCDYAA